MSSHQLLLKTHIHLVPPSLSLAVPGLGASKSGALTAKGAINNNIPSLPLLSALLCCCPYLLRLCINWTSRYLSADGFSATCAADIGEEERSRGEVWEEGNGTIDLRQQWK